MLLYIDKKKQKRQKIKILAIIFTILFFIISNLIQFPISLNNSKQKIAHYTSNQNSVHKLPNAVTVFAVSQYATPKIIQIPSPLNREEIKTLTQIFKKHADKIKTIYITPEVQTPQTIQTILRTVIPDLKITNNKETSIIITTAYNNFASLIQKESLYPYTKIQSKKITLPQSFYHLQDSFFPLPIIPDSILKAEQINLQNFANDYKTEIQTYVSTNRLSEIPFPQQHLFLQNVNICLSYDNKHFCNLENQLSLAHKLTILSQKLPKNAQNIKLNLLTTQQNINSIDNLNEDDGILFRYGVRESILLPGSYKKTESFQKLKKDAGLNPEYQNKNMNFYKFKTVEINLDDKI